MSLAAAMDLYRHVEYRHACITSFMAIALRKSPSEDFRLKRPLPTQGRHPRRIAVCVRPLSAQDSCF